MQLDNTEQTEQVTPSLAERLVTARKKAGLSLDDVAAQLHLAKSQLEEFESESLVLQSLSTFQRGYLRAYADYIGINKAEVDDFLPSESGIETDLQTIECESFTSTTPLMARKWVKSVLWILVMVVVVYVLVSSGFDLNSLIESASQVNLSEELSLSPPAQ